MQIFIFCFFVIGIICVIQGIRKSTFRLARNHKQHCAKCGWTKEKVQLCQFEQHHKTMVASLCFDCSIKLDARPVRDISVDEIRTVYV
ncbi:MAG: hypothetical protein JOZ18_22750 [Chloroflexi bacterium]|nr:hypothetical protein [Chloroflexota bacterium]